MKKDDQIEIVFRLYMPRALTIWIQWQLSNGNAKEMRSPNKRTKKKSTTPPPITTMYTCVSVCCISVYSVFNTVYCCNARFPHIPFIYLEFVQFQ